MQRVGSLLMAMSLISCNQPAYADKYGYYPGALHIGGSFDPRKMSNLYPPCLSSNGVYQIDKLGATNDHPGSIVSPDKPEDQSKAVAISTEFTIKEVKTRQELYNYLNVSASVSGHYGFFSGEAAANYEKENSFESDSFTWIVRATSNYGSWGLVNPRLNSEAAKLKSNVTALYGRCGTEWVGTETRAVLIAAVYSVKNLSQSSREHLSASFSGGIDTGVWGAEAAAKYESFKKEASNAANLELNIYALGGPGITTLKTLISKSDIDNVKQTMESYTSQLTAANAVPVGYVTGPILSLLNGGDYDLALYNKAIGDLFLAREDYAARQNRIREIVNQSDDYNLSQKQIEKLQEHFERIGDVLKNYDDVANACRSAFLSATGKRSVDQPKTASACNVHSAKLLYNKKIEWPSAQPFAVSWWTEDNQFAPKRWLYVEVTGARLQEANILASDRSVLNALKVEADQGAGKKATGALEFSGVPTSKFPFALSMTSESGNVYQRPLNVSSTANSTLAIIPSANSEKLSVESLDNILKNKNIDSIRSNLNTLKSDLQ